MNIQSQSFTSYAPAPAAAVAAPEVRPLLDMPLRPSSRQAERRTSVTLQSGLACPKIAVLHETPITGIVRQPYTHGGFMALARSFYQDATWLSRLTRLMPRMRNRVDALIGDRALHAALPEVMALLENNPILAAYGTSRAGEAPPAIEWDIWLSPYDASDLNGARIIHGNAIAEAMATLTPQAARAMLDQSQGGSDVHTGTSVAAWKALFEQALTEAGVKRPVDALQPLFLDVKSTYSTGQDINTFVASCAAAGFCIKGVGTFAFEQLDGLSAALPVHLFSTAQDFIHAAAAGVLPQEASAIFNGGSLLEPQQTDPTQWQIDAHVLSGVARVQQAGSLNLAVYIQETRADWQALDCLTRCINANAHIFAMGFAYGGLKGVADTTIASGRGVRMLFAQAV